MDTLFEVHLTPGSSADDLLSEEAKRDTNAQVMTTEEAKSKGFRGLPDLGPNVRFIGVPKARDAGWIRNVLEASPVVAGFNIHHLA